jgi:hypothetical protein
VSLYIVAAILFCLQLFGVFFFAFKFLLTLNDACEAKQAQGEDCVSMGGESFYFHLIVAHVAAGISTMAFLLYVSMPARAVKLSLAALAALPVFLCALAVGLILVDIELFIGVGVLCVLVAMVYCIAPAIRSICREFPLRPRLLRQHMLRSKTTYEVWHFGHIVLSSLRSYGWSCGSQPWPTHLALDIWEPVTRTKMKMETRPTIALFPGVACVSTFISWFRCTGLLKS